MGACASTKSETWEENRGRGGKVERGQCSWQGEGEGVVVVEGAG